MDWLRWWMGKRGAPAASWSLPRRMDAIPGTLAMTVYAHEIAAAEGLVPCWSFVSDGLLGHGQKEIVVTVARSRAEHPAGISREFSDFLAMVHQLAARGQRVDEGDITVFRGRGPGGANGVAYLRPERMAGVEMPLSALTAIPLMGAEAEVARAFGVTRIMSRLALHYRYYPCPPWWERGREAIAASSSEDTSLLARLGRVRLTGVSARMDGGSIKVRVHPSARERFTQAVAKAAPTGTLAILTDPDIEADGLLVWTPGQDRPKAATPEGSRGERLALCFVGFAVGTEDTEGRLIEDGAVMMCTTHAWEKFLEAAVSGEPVTIPPTVGTLDLELDWIVGTYVSPVDGRAYGADGGWRTYHPAEAKPADHHRVLDRIVLLAGASEGERRVTARALSDYIGAIEHAFVARVGDRTEHVEIVVRVELWPGEPARVVGGGDLDERQIAAMIEPVPPPEVSGGSVAFECRLRSRPRNAEI